MRATCRLKRNLFLPCRRAAIASCQYCGRSFCGVHGQRLDDRQEICLRARCQEKRRDMERHESFRREVFTRNRRGQCGEETCEERCSAQCSKCQGLFCEAHLQERPHHVILHGQRSPQMGSLCEHCWQRRGIWEKC